MKDIKIIEELEILYKNYEKEVYKAKEDGFLQDNTVKTYLTHTRNFVKWCKGDFEPGAKNK